MSHIPKSFNNHTFIYAFKICPFLTLIGLSDKILSWITHSEPQTPGQRWSRHAIPLLVYSRILPIQMLWHFNFWKVGSFCFDVTFKEKRGIRTPGFNQIGDPSIKTPSLLTLRELQRWHWLSLFLFPSNEATRLKLTSNPTRWGRKEDKCDTRAEGRPCTHSHQHRLHLHFQRGERPDRVVISCK